MKPDRKAKAPPVDPGDPERRADIAALFSRLEQSYAKQPESESTDRALSRDEEGVLDDLRFLIVRSRNPGALVDLLRVVAAMLAANALDECSPALRRPD